MTFQERIDNWLDFRAGENHQKHNYNDLFVKSEKGNYVTAYAVTKTELETLRGHMKHITKLIFHLGVTEDKLTPFLQYGDDVESHSLLLKETRRQSLPENPLPQSTHAQGGMSVSAKAADSMIRNLYGLDMNETIYTKEGTPEIVRNFSFKKDMVELKEGLPITQDIHFWFGVYSHEELETPGTDTSKYPVLNVLLSLHKEIKHTEVGNADDDPYDFSVPCPPTCEPPPVSGGGLA